MLVAEMPHSVMKKNNNYSHCPLKKRPFYYTSEDEDEAPEVTKGDYREIIHSLLCKNWNYFYHVHLTFISHRLI